MFYETQVEGVVLAYYRLVLHSARMNIIKKSSYCCKSFHISVAKWLFAKISQRFYIKSKQKQ